MFDPFLLLTPLLALVVLALVRYIGCAEIADIDEWPGPEEPVSPDAPPAPTNLTVQYGDETVTLSWTAAQGVTDYMIRFTNHPTAPLADGPTVSGTTTFVDVLTFNVTRRYHIVAVKDGLKSYPSNEVTVTGARQLLPLIETFGTPQSFFSGFLGMKVTVTTRVKIVALGRVKHLKVLPNPVPIVHTHGVMIWLPGLPAPTLVEGAKVAIVPQSGVEAGDFLYETLTTDIFFEPGTTFYVVSQEYEKTDANPDADEWHDFDTTAFPHPEATLDEAVYKEDAAVVFSESTGGPNHLYVPVNALYHPAPLPQP